MMNWVGHITEPDMRARCDPHGTTGYLASNALADCPTCLALPPRPMLPAPTEQELREHWERQLARDFEIIRLNGYGG